MVEFKKKDFYTISEVEEFTSIKKYTIRYWEKVGLFSSLNVPFGYKRYTNENIESILRIKDLIYNKKYSTKMVKFLFFSKNIKKENLKGIDIKDFLYFLKKEIQKIINIIY